MSHWLTDQAKARSSQSNVFFGALCMQAAVADEATKELKRLMLDHWARFVLEQAIPIQDIDAAELKAVIVPFDHDLAIQVCYELRTPRRDDVVIPNEREPVDCCLQRTPGGRYVIVLGQNEELPALGHWVDANWIDKEVERAVSEIQAEHV